MEVLCARNKENPTPIDNHHKQIQSLRVELTDKLFEIRRLEEDQAQERAQFFLSMQKEKQASTKAMQEMKASHEQENDAWAAKVDQVRKYHQVDLEKLQSALQKEAQQAQQHQKQ